MAQALNEPVVLDRGCFEDLESWEQIAVEVMMGSVGAEVAVGWDFGRFGWVAAPFELLQVRAVVVAVDSGSEQARRLV